MGKKKNVTLYQLDEKLDERYRIAIEEIQFYQADIKRAERKAKKKAVKQMRKGNNWFDPSYEIQVRKEIIHKMEGDNFFDRIEKILYEIKPICMIIARLVMSLIVSILSIDSVKYRIQPNTLTKMKTVYDVAKSISGPTNVKGIEKKK